MGADESKIYIALLTGACVQVTLMIFFVVTIFRYYRKKKSFQLLKLKRDFKFLDQEKQRIAYDLHDDLGASLSAIKLRLHLVPEINEKSAIIINDCEGLISEAMEKLKRISLNLMPRILDRMGLDEALRDLISILTYPTSIKVDYAYDATIGKESSLHIYRIAQEVLNNIIKHAQASHIFFNIHETTSNVRVQIKDNGIGFHPEEAMKNSGQGLENIAARVGFLKADLYLTSSPGKGTEYLIKIPPHGKDNRSNRR